MPTIKLCISSKLVVKKFILAEKNPEYYPIEACRIVGGQPVRGKLADQEVSGMIRAVATPAPVTFNRIRDMMNYVKPQFEADLATVGIEVDSKMVKGDFA